jgi:hypothetical protein
MVLRGGDTPIILVVTEEDLACYKLEYLLSLADYVVFSIHSHDKRLKNVISSMRMRYKANLALDVARAETKEIYGGMGEFEFNSSDERFCTYVFPNSQYVAIGHKFFNGKKFSHDRMLFMIKEQPVYTLKTKLMGVHNIEDVGTWHQSWW